MELDREWFEIFFSILNICLLPGFFACVAFFGKAGTNEEESMFQAYPKGFDGVAAALVRLANYVLLFAILFTFLNPYHGRFSRSGAVWEPLFCLVLAGCVILLLVAGLFKRRNPDLSNRAFIWLLLGLLLFFAVSALTPVLL